MTHERPTIPCVAKWRVKRRLAATGTRLKTLREEIAVIDEQILYLRDDADDAATRAIVSENSEAKREARQAREQVEALRSQRDRVVREIADLELRQDDLLDELTRTD